MAASSNVKLLRQLISEIRQAVPEGPVRHSHPIRYILNQFQKYKTTDQQLCKAQEEMKFMASTYLCYMRSGRKYNEINQQFHGKGERTIEQTANMVGFKLPHDPK
ncbi:uncharacterized protein CBL_12757 [Carabus blaptoides fortunei]